MTIKGHIRNGVIVLDDHLDLPDGIEVSVQIAATGQSSTWAERLKNIIGTVDDLPVDTAKNHDHYLHGAPKK